MSTVRKQPVAGRCADGKRRCQGTHPLICETHGCAILEGRAAAVECQKRADAEREAFVAARGWAVLEKRVKALLREARRRYKVQLTLKAKCNEWGKASAAGRIGALADVQDAMKALKTAPPNEALSNGGTAL